MIAVARPQQLDFSAARAIEMSMLDRVAGGETEAQLLIWECEACLVVPRRLAMMTAFPQAAGVIERRGLPVNVR